MIGFAVLGRVPIFFLTFTVGVLTAWLPSRAAPENSDITQPINIFRESGSGMAACHGKFLEDSEPGPQTYADSSKLQIISKPQPAYTDEARNNLVNGPVILRVTFLASGNIGSVEPIATLPDGLTERAIEAAKRIQFKPKWEAGRPISVTRTVEYDFTVH